MIIEFEGRSWDWEPAEVDVAIARKVRDITGKGLVSWGRGIGDGDPDCLLAMWWAIRHQNGEPKAVTELEAGFQPNKFWVAVNKASMLELQRQAAEADQEAPGRPKGRTRARTRTSAGTGTSTSSS